MTDNVENTMMKRGKLLARRLAAYGSDTKLKSRYSDRP